MARLRLNSVACWGGDRVNRLLAAFGGAAEILARPVGELACQAMMGFDALQRIRAQASAFDPEKDLELARLAGVRVLTALDEDYPAALRAIYDPPLAVYIKGELRDLPAAAIVGTRRATPYGLRMAARLARELCENGVAVASGLARGVDTAAHQAAVEAGGVTWAAMGTGLCEIYPRENERLAGRIVDGGGALISEFPMEEGSRPANFPRRNRIISALSLATVVVEGGFESGALITARSALEQGKEVLAVPGQADAPMAKGPNHLIKNGASLAETAGDIINCFPPGTRLSKGVTTGEIAYGQPAALKSLSPDAGEAYSAIAGAEAGLSADELAEKLAWPVQRTAASLFELEVSALVGTNTGRYVVK